MNVYRVENAEGEGPYNSEATTKLKKRLSRRLEESHSTEAHPNFEEDFDETTPTSYFFGFETIEKLKEWFTVPFNFLELLNSTGFFIACYEVDDEWVINGRSQKQLIFNKLEAKLKSTQSCLNLLL